MKKRNLLYAGLILVIIVSFNACFFDHDTQIHVNDDEDEYHFRASFDDDLTHEVQDVINRHLGRHHSGPVAYLHTDCDFDLADGTKFYLKLKPGRVRIRFDRSDNSEENFTDMRDMCEEIKDVLAGRDDN